MKPVWLTETAEVFGDTPDVRLLWQSDQIKAIYADIIQALYERTPLLKVIADAGTGKTLLCRKVFFSLKAHASRYEVDLLPYPSIDAGELKIRLIGLSNTRHTVILIDEAQAVSNDALLVISKHLAKTDNLSIVLFGQPLLESKLANAKLARLSEIMQKCYHLRALTREETEQYIQARLALAGFIPEGEWLNTQVIESIFSLSHGVPRVINTLMRRAAVIATQSEAAGIELTHLQQASNMLELQHV
jgi:type II secretory pathway predicted ATPase ExeA